MASDPSDDDDTGPFERTLDVAAAALHLVSSARDERDLMQGLCDLLGRAGYALAWIGLVRPDPEPHLEPVAWTGDEEYVRQAQVRCDDGPRAQGPGGRSIRENRAVAFNALASSKDFAPWQAAARARGYAAVCSVPLRVEGAVIGSVGVYATREDAFGAHEIARLEEMIAAAGRVLELFRAREAMATALDDARGVRDQLSAIQRASPDMIFLHGGDGRILDVNELTTAKYGLTREQLIHGPPEQIMGEGHTLEEAIAWVQRAMETGSAEFEWTARRGDDSTMPVEVRLRRIPGASGHPEEPTVVAVVRDLTERKQMDAQLLESAKLESLAWLAGGIAHDFNNALTAVLAALGMVEQELPPERPLRGLVRDAIEAAMQARGLTRQLLTFARGGASVATVFAPGVLVEQTVRLVLVGTAIAPQVELADGLWSVRGDRDQLAQVFHNLVLNAVQAMGPRGALVVRGRNVLLDRPAPPLRPGRYVRFEVEDTGPGIAPEHLPRIFDPFFTTKPQGTGLGLPTSFAAVRRHGGHLEARSEPGVGTTFVIHLPASEEEAAAPASTPSTAVRPLRVLLLDDEETLRRLIGGMLVRMGHHVLEAENGDRALELVARERDAGHAIDVALLDLTVRGGRGGLEILAELRSVQPATVVVGMSGYADASLEDAGFDAFLPKPFGLTQMETLLAELPVGARER
jgi:PAS domain S-box-containing protein